MFRTIATALLTISDSRTVQDDHSGDLLASSLMKAGHRLVDRRLVRDDRYAIRAVVSGWIADERVWMILTTGGTGLSATDVTPEAILPLLDRRIDGFAELFRTLSYREIGSSTIHSRLLAGIAGDTLLFCLPGSTGACRTGWSLIEEQLDADRRRCNLADVVMRWHSADTGQVGSRDSGETTNKLPSVTETRSLLLKDAPRLRQVERLRLGEAEGRVVAEPIPAPFPLPPEDRSAVDGYAIRSEDLRKGDGPPQVELPLTLRVEPGTSPPALPPTSCARILTGSQVPPGADAIVMQEYCRIGEAGSVRFPTDPPPAYSNIRRRGEDIAEGEQALDEGTPLTPSAIGLLAQFGIGEVAVRRRCRVALLTTGDELVPIATRRLPGQSYDSNRWLLASLLGRLGCSIVATESIADDREAIEGALRRCAAEADMIVTTGGVSVGDRDWIPDIVRRLGSIILHKTAIKPGKPILYGRIGETPLFGLPGNPASCFVGTVAFIRPYLRSMMGMKEPESACRGAYLPLSRSLPADLRQRWLIATIEDHPQGRRIVPFSHQSSGSLVTLSRADGVAVIPHGRPIAAGESVEWLPLDTLHGC